MPPSCGELVAGVAGGLVNGGWGALEEAREGGSRHPAVVGYWVGGEREEGGEGDERKGFGGWQAGVAGRRLSVSVSAVSQDSRIAHPLGHPPTLPATIRTFCTMQSFNHPSTNPLPACSKTFQEMGFTVYGGENAPYVWVGFPGACLPS